jgi:hypothetical protein
VRLCASYSNNFTALRRFKSSERTSHVAGRKGSVCRQLLNRTDVHQVSGLKQAELWGAVHRIRTALAEAYRRQSEENRDMVSQALLQDLGSKWITTDHHPLHHQVLAVVIQFPSHSHYTLVSYFASRAPVPEDSLLGTCADTLPRQRQCTSTLTGYLCWRRRAMAHGVGRVSKITH